MPRWLVGWFGISLVIPLFALVPEAFSAASATWLGVLHDTAGNSISDATVNLRSVAGGQVYTVKTSKVGAFVFSEIVSGEYELSVTTSAGTSKAANPVKIQEASRLTDGLVLAARGQLAILPEPGGIVGNDRGRGAGAQHRARARAGRRDARDRAGRAAGAGPGRLERRGRRGGL